MKTKFVAGCLAVLVFLGWAAAAPGAGGKMNALPTYTLPDSAAADGKLAEWAGVPPVPAERHFFPPKLIERESSATAKPRSTRR